MGFAAVDEVEGWLGGVGGGRGVGEVEGVRVDGVEGAGCWGVCRVGFGFFGSGECVGGDRGC